MRREQKELIHQQQLQIKELKKKAKRSRSKLKKDWDCVSR
jgi:hypothetical protein